jgi:rubrerythrin
MALHLRNEKGVPIDRQVFTWRDLVRTPISKLNDDAFTRVRIILLNGIEMEALHFQHACARMNERLRKPLAEVRQIEKHQQTLVNWLLPPDQSPLETTIAYEQVAIEVTAQVAKHEPDPYLAQVYRFGMLEDFDHLYRYSALLDRLEGKDANNILQSYTDIHPGRPTVVEHRAAQDNLRDFYNRQGAAPITKLNALTILSGEQQTQNYYENIGPLFADPIARQLYAEIASIEEQHVTQYESLIDPNETWLEKWLLHECCEVYNYYSCMQTESNPRIKEIWTRFLDYELGHLAVARDLFEQIERRDASEIIPDSLPEPIKYESNRHFIKQVLNSEVELRAIGTQLVDKSLETPDLPSVRYRMQINSEGSPSEIVAAGYVWMPGTEAARLAGALLGTGKEVRVQ